METINVEVPKSLIPELENRNFNGAILLYMNKLNVVDGFALEDNEFVTSLDALKQASVLAGFTLHNSDIIEQ